MPTTARARQRGRILERMAAGTESGDAFLAVGELLDREVALDALLRTLVRRIAAAMQADRGTLYLVDQGRGELFTKAADLPELPEIRLALGQGVAGHVAQTGETVNVPTTTTDDRFYRGVDAQTGYETRSILAVPMRDAAGRILGVVQLLNKDGGAFTRDDEVGVAALAREAATAIETTTLYERLFRSPDDAAEGLALSDRFNRILGESDAMRAAYRIVTRAAASEATVLVHGESGTGKELFARAVHVNSKRRSAPFVKIDCAALPAGLIENELFGHERGAYTGADSRADGKVDRAKGGTLFLDEIGELPLPAQGKLLRLLQDGDFNRVGGARAVRADVRVVAATNRDLEARIAEKAFRADLYYRLRVVDISLPPLRTRGPGDVALLARHFAVAAARRHGRPVPRISEAAMARLTAYPWPGNVRELEHCLESAVIIAEAALLEPADLPLPSRAIDRVMAASTGMGAPPSPPTPPADGTDRRAAGETLAEVETAHIQKILAACGGNKSEAARRLGIGRNTLLRKLKRL